MKSFKITDSLTIPYALQSEHPSGQYEQNRHCSFHTQCAPCARRFISCVGLGDGLRPVPTHQWRSDFIECLWNRTLNRSSCHPGEYFNPRLSRCMTNVEKSELDFRLLTSTSVKWKDNFVLRGFFFRCQLGRHSCHSLLVATCYTITPQTTYTWTFLKHFVLIDREQHHLLYDPLILWYNLTKSIDMIIFIKR